MLKKPAIIFLFFLAFNFSFAQFQLNGDASQIDCFCYQLTPDLNLQTGTVWSPTMLSLNDPFDFEFEIFLGCNGQTGADGLVFVLQPVNTTQIGTTASGLGYIGITPSIGVEIDSYTNTWDPACDHMAINSNGVVDHNIAANNLAGPLCLPTVADCSYHTLQIIWEPTTNTFTAIYDGIHQLTYVNDIVTSIFNGNPNVYWGFTAGTGGMSNEHRFCFEMDPMIAYTGSLCVHDSVMFFDSTYHSVGNSSDWLWDFGNGDTSTLQNPVYVYNTPGTYSVELTVTNNFSGCELSVITDITINPLPLPNISSDTAICLGTNASLTASGGTVYEWAPAADLSHSDIPNPLAFPTQTTTFTVTVTDQMGCVAIDSTVVTVVDPVAHVSSDTTVCPGTPAQLNASGGVAYLWIPGSSLNDSLSASPIATPFTTTNYTVVIADSIGCTASASVLVNVQQFVTADFNSDGFCEEDSTNFFDNSTDIIGTINNWSWDFGDGHTAIATATPSHLYQQPGIYNVTLYVENDYGCRDTITKTIEIYEKPDIAFAYQPVVLCAPAEVHFTATSTNSVSYEWLFGDGSSATIQNPYHTYLSPGNYSVIVTATSVNNCSNYQQQSITVHNPPTADFIPNPPLSNTLHPVSFNNTSVGGNLWLWDFGDGNSSADENPSHLFNDAGTYMVHLEVQDINNCTDTISKKVIILELTTMYVPNAFNPNGDGINDYFGPIGEGINSDYYEMYIYDRWGKLIFHTNDINNLWDGRSKDGRLMPQDVYTWIIFLRKHIGTDHKHRYTGTVTLM